MNEDTPILSGESPGKIRKPGRPRGSGRNQLLLEKLTKPDSCIWGVSYKKMRSIAVCAAYAGITIKVRKLDDVDRKKSTFAIWRIS